ncbi:MAG: IS4 family transposase [Anaerolineales bacterium]|nr:IS4 family transposase [Anaerolineales bacterium]MCB0030181.1 IS4 family transposase [Anaerolineales bacterium]
MTIIPEISQKIRTVLGTAAAECAEEAQLVQRQGGKVNGVNLSQTLVLGWWQDPEASLEQLCQMGASVGLVLSPQGLDQRFNARTATFLRRLLARVLVERVGGEKVAVEILDRFSGVYVQDSSIVTLPAELRELWPGNGGKGTASTVKLETQLEMKRGELDGPHLVPGRLHDRCAEQQHAPIETNALQLKDLGYWSLDSLQAAAAAGCWWVSRLKLPTMFRVAGTLWTADQWCLQQQGDTFEVVIELGMYHRLPARLLGQRVPPDVAAERRRKLKRAAQKRGSTLTRERLRLCDWTLLVTNAPAALIAYDEAFVLMRLRWQIELLFKLWKSEGKIDKSRSDNVWRRLCEFYAKLIAMLLQHWLLAVTIWDYADRSWVKASRTIRQHVIRLATALDSAAACRRVLHDLRRILSRGCRINKSRKQQRTFSLLLACGDGDA